MPALSRHAAMYLVVVSHTAMQCPKVRRELAAVSTIRNRGNFVVPVMVERLPTAALPPELQQLDMVDCSQNWAHGLTQLIDRLKKAGVPRTPEPMLDGVLARWQQHLAMPNALRPARTELYRSNWFAFTLPQSLSIYTLGTSEPKALQNLSLPVLPD